MLNKPPPEHFKNREVNTHPSAASEFCFVFVSFYIRPEPRGFCEFNGT